MDHSVLRILPIFLFAVCVIGLAGALLVLANLFNPSRPGRVKQMPYESGMDPVHDTRRRFDVRFHLLAIAFLVFDVELLFLYPWAVASRPAAEAAAKGPGARGQGSELTDEGSGFMVQGSDSANPNHPSSPRGIDAAVANGWVESRDVVFVGVMVFVALLVLGFVYDWRKGVFQWR